MLENNVGTYQLYSIRNEIVPRPQTSAHGCGFIPQRRIRCLT